MANTAPDQDEVLRSRLKRGDTNALAEIFALHKRRLWRMVDLRLDDRLRYRIDPEDVLQESYLNAAQRLNSLDGNSSVSVYIWLRLVVMQTLVNVHRRHVVAKARDVRREVDLRGYTCPQATSTSIVAHLVDDATSPSQAAIRAEVKDRLIEALERMDPIDREVLALRHFEELSNREVAEVLGIRQNAASIRYVRALKRLRVILRGFPGFSDSERERESV